MLKRFILDETGATAIEYGLIASMFAVSVVGSVALLGDEYKNMYASIATTVTSVINP